MKTQMGNTDHPKGGSPRIKSSTRCFAPRCRTTSDTGGLLKPVTLNKGSKLMFSGESKANIQSEGNGALQNALWLHLEGGVQAEGGCAALQHSQLGPQNIRLRSTTAVDTTAEVLHGTSKKKNKPKKPKCFV